MCSTTVVKPPRRKLRGWLATRRPRTNISTVDAVSRIELSEKRLDEKMAESEVPAAEFQVGHAAKVILVAGQEDSAACQTDTGDEVVRHADPLPL